MSTLQRQEGVALEAEFLVTVYDPNWKVLWAHSKDVIYLQSISGLPFKSGDYIRVKGRTRPGKNEIDWENANIEVLREKAWGEPFVLTSENADAADGKWALLEGYVTKSQQIDADHVQLALHLPGKSIIINLLAPPDSELLDLSGHRISARGAYSIKRNLSGAITSRELWVPGRDSLRILNPVSSDPAFLLPVTSIAEIEKGSVNGMVRLRATAREQKLGRSLVIEEGNDLLVAETWQINPVAPGEQVDVAGYPRKRGPRIVLEEAMFRSVGATNVHLKEKIRLASQVRSMSPADANLRKPVVLRGVVTWSATNYPFLFLQDSSAGICVEMAEDRRHEMPQPGDAIVVTGVTDSGDFAPWVREARSEHLGTLDLPDARTITLDHALTGVEDSQWVQMEGYLRSVQDEDGLARLDLSTASGDFVAFTEWSEELGQSVGAVVRLKGACGAAVTSQKEISGVLLYVPSSCKPEVIEPALANPFHAPKRSIDSLRRFHAISTRNRRIRVAGTVTAHFPGRFLVLQKGQHALTVLTRDQSSLKVGEHAEAAGLLGSDRTRLTLREAVLRRTGENEPILPVQFEGKSLEELKDSILVRSRCLLLDKSETAQQTRLTLQNAGGMLFDAVLHGPSSEAMHSVQPRSVVDVVGVAQVLPDEQGQPHSMRLLLRGPKDLAVIDTPPLLTIERAGTLLAIAALVVLGLFAWTRYLQRKIKKQTAQMLLQLKRKAELQSQYRSLVENASDWIFTIGENGLFGSSNAAGEAITGYTPAQALGLRLEQLVHPEDLPMFKHLSDLHDGNPAAATQQFRIRRKDGKDLWLELKSAPLAQSASPSHWLGIARDITARKEYEEQMRLAKEAAEANTRARGEFLANMSHEIRTPMNGVLGMCQLLLETGLTSEQRDFAETIRTSSDALLTVINDILDLSKIEAGKLELENVEFNLRDEVESAMELVAARAARKPIEISSFIPPEIPCLLLGDHGRLRQVLLNLAGNAVKFTERGEVSLSVSLVEESSAEARLRFDVSDTGIGISEEALARLFQPFTQADSSTTRRFGGTGLGLAISARIVAQMGGEISVRSAPGRGSTFTFTAPFKKQLRPQAPLSPHAVFSARTIVVDDNATNRRIVQHYLKSWGMPGEAVESGAEALARIKNAAQSGKPFDLALIDCVMDGMNGLELARQIKAACGPQNPGVVLLTSLGSHFEEAFLRDAGIDRSLRKPFRQADLLAAIKGALQNRRGFAAEQASATPSIALPAEPSEAGRSLKVLLAEDNLVNQKVAQRQLQKLGHSVVSALNGREALALVRSEPFDAVLMDCQMPEMDGYEATREIRRTPGLENTFIIAMTANAMEGDREKCLEAGMDDYVAKPVRIQDLEAALLRCPAASGRNPAPKA